ncbi:MAG: hypothetical protein JO305_01845 [Alphaproteobacteria bacterium]|nr:hypothetical protein [Alphaproteobacteria bacterium]
MNCPYCAEEIKESAQVCKHCGRDFLLLRPLLDQLLAHGKRLEGHETDLGNIAALLRRRGHRGRELGVGLIPALSPVNAVVLCVIALFVTSFFFELALFARSVQAVSGSSNVVSFDAGRDQLSADILAIAFFLVTFAFGLMCQPAKQRPFVADMAAGISIMILSVVARHFAWSALRPGVPLLPRQHDVLVGLSLLAASTFLSFTAGGFVRYLVLSRSKEAPPITYATDLSRYLVGHHGADPAQMAERVKSFEAVVHSLLAVLTTVAAILGTWQAIEKLRQTVPPPAKAAAVVVAPVLAHAPAPAQNSGP